MNRIYHYLAKASSSIPLKLLIKLSQRSNIFPFYHTVSDQDLVHIKHLYKIKSLNEFENDLDFLLKHYTPLDYCDYKQSILGQRKIKKRTFLLTFDDGLREFDDHIAPILLRKGIPAICFLNSAFIDNKELFYRHKVSVIIDKLIELRSRRNVSKDVKSWFSKYGLSLSCPFKSLKQIGYLNRHILDELALLIEISFTDYLHTVKPYLTTSQINELIKKGFYFGAHSIDHPLFADITPTQQLEQIKQSVKEITGRFELEYKLFSFPFSDSGVSFSLFEDLKKDSLVDFTFGTAGLKRDDVRQNIQRISMEIDGLPAKEILAIHYLYCLLKEGLFINKISRNES